MTRRTKLTDAEIDRWNYLRERANEEPIDKTMAEAVLSKVSDETYMEIMERIA